MVPPSPRDCVGRCVLALSSATPSSRHLATRLHTLILPIQFLDSKLQLTPHTSPASLLPPPQAEKKAKKDQKEEAEKHQKLQQDLDDCRSAHFTWQVGGWAGAGARGVAYLGCSSLHLGGQAGVGTKQGSRRTDACVRTWHSNTY